MVPLRRAAETDQESTNASLRFFVFRFNVRKRSSILRRPGRVSNFHAYDSVRLFVGTEPNFPGLQLDGVIAARNGKRAEAIGRFIFRRGGRGSLQARWWGLQVLRLRGGCVRGGRRQVCVQAGAKHAPSQEARPNEQHADGCKTKRSHGSGLTAGKPSAEKSSSPWIHPARSSMRTCSQRSAMSG